MNVVKVSGLALCLGSTIASANPCDGFQLKVKNNLADDLLVTRIKLEHADLAPGGLQKLDKKTEQAFTVNNSAEAMMIGQFSFHTISLPSHTVKIHYTLENKGVVCEFTQTSVEGDYSVDTNRLFGHVAFSINNR